MFIIPSTLVSNSPNEAVTKEPYEMKTNALLLFPNSTLMPRPIRPIQFHWILCCVQLYSWKFRSMLVHLVHMLSIDFGSIFRVFESLERICRKLC
jgi:hypothetical protein